MAEPVDKLAVQTNSESAQVVFEADSTYSDAVVRRDVVTNTSTDLLVTHEVVLDDGNGTDLGKIWWRSEISCDAGYTIDVRDNYGRPLASGNPTDPGSGGDNPASIDTTVGVMRLQLVVHCEDLAGSWSVSSSSPGGSGVDRTDSWSLTYDGNVVFTGTMHSVLQ